MNNLAARRRALRRGIAYLVKAQLDDGSFAIVATPKETVAIPLSIDLQVHALLLDILLSVHSQEIQPVTQKLAHYLEQRIHLVAEQELFGHTDTYALFYGLSVLYEYDPALVTPRLTGTAVRFLVEHEQHPGGPYYNALDKHTSSPDISTNLAICRFIHHIGGPFPVLTDYLARHTTSGSRYTAKTWPLKLQIFRLSSLFDTPEKHGGWKPASPTDKGVAAQHIDGSWPVEYIHFDPHTTPQRTFGSAALATAFMIATLESAKIAPAHHAAQSSPDFYSAIAAAAYEDLHGLSPLITVTLRARLNKLIQADTNNEIGPLAVRFAADLVPTYRIPARTLQTLGAANLFNWVAYTIYDDFLDNEGDPQLLSAANVALRKAVALFCQTVPDTAFSNLVAQTFDTVDTANAWELEHCRFITTGTSIRIAQLPNYGRLQSLYNRSLSHSLPVIGTLAAAGLATDSPAVQSIQKALHHYLIVRQLSDDLHDWKEDVQVGHISYVVARILSDAHVSKGDHHLAKLLPRLERAFWRESARAIAQEMAQHVIAAKQLLAKSRLTTHNNVIGQLVQELEDIANRLIAEQSETRIFLQTFQAS